MNWDWLKSTFISGFGAVIVFCVGLLAFFLTIFIGWVIKKLKHESSQIRWSLFLITFLFIFNLLFWQEEYMLTFAVLGNRHAQLLLGYSYSCGRGIIKQNDLRSLYWFSKASDQGDPVAQVYLGYAYELGRGVPKDAVKAAYWYQKASQAGHRGAEERLNFLKKTQPSASIP